MPRRSPDPPRPLVGRPRRTRDLLDAGVTHGQLAGPRWTSILRGVHGSEVDASHPLTRILAAAELMPRGAVLGGWAALHLLGVRNLDGRSGPGGATLLPVPVCTGPPGRMAPRPGLRVDRSTLREADVSLARGVPITSAVRACADIARWYGVEEGVVAGDAAARAGVTRPNRLRAYVGQLARVPGVPSAQAAARLVDAGSHSAPESRLRCVWVLEAGLPTPLVNPDVVDMKGGHRVGRADLLDAEAALVGEYDGDHHRTLAQHTADNDREESFERLNLTVVRASALDLWPRRQRLVERLQAAYRDGLARDRARDGWAFRRR